MRIVKTPPTVAADCFYCPRDIEPPRPVHAVAQLSLDEGSVAICQSCVDHLEKHPDIATSLEYLARLTLRRSKH
jgi:hypothetical protein